MGKRPGLLGALSGLLAALALPPVHFWPLAFLALVPLAIAVRADPDGREGAVRAGLGFGALYYGILLHWVPPTLHGMVPLGAISGLLLVAILAGVGGIQGLALRALMVKRGVPPVLALPLIWGGTEFLLAHAGPFAFPWLPLALALAPRPELAGIAEWVGAGGVTLWIAAVNGGIVGAIPIAANLGSGLQPRRRRLGPGAALLLLLTLPAAWGWWRSATLPLAPLPPVLLVQLDLPREILIDPAARDPAAEVGIDRILSSLPGASPAGGAAAPVLAIFPEAPLAAGWGPEMETRMWARAARIGLPTLWGAHISLPEDGSRGPGLRNAILLLDPAAEGGELLHAKARLVPGVERPGLTPGPRGEPPEVGGVRLGILICFEAAFGSEVRRLRRGGAELLVNPSNDGWFRPGGGGAALAQHRAHLVLRSVEGRIGAVRTSLGGELLVVDPTGRIAALGAAGGEGTLLASPRTTGITTGFVRFGELGGWAGLLLFGALFVRGKRISSAATLAEGAG